VTDGAWRGYRRYFEVAKLCSFCVAEREVA